DFPSWRGPRRGSGAGGEWADLRARPGAWKLSGRDYILRLPGHSRIPVRAVHRRLRWQPDRHPVDPGSPPRGLFLRAPSEDLAEGPSSGPPVHRPGVEKFRRVDPAVGWDRHAGPAWAAPAHDTDRRVADGLPGEAGDRAQARQPAPGPTGHQSHQAALRSAAPADR